jgi:hypothetical protein
MEIYIDAYIGLPFEIRVVEDHQIIQHVHIQTVRELVDTIEVFEREYKIDNAYVLGDPKFAAALVMVLPGELNLQVKE